MAKIKPPHRHLEVTLLKNLTTKELIDVGNQIVKGKVDEVTSYARDPNASALQVMIASVVAHIIKHGDMRVLDLLLNRLVGKVKDEIALSGQITNPPQVVITLPANNRTNPDLIDVTPQTKKDDGYSFD